MPALFFLQRSAKFQKNKSKEVTRFLTWTKIQGLRRVESPMKRIVTYILALTLCLGLVMPLGAFAEAADNLTIKIRNNDGLPAMDASQFKVYQIFTGRTNEEYPSSEAPADTNKDRWNATEWNNWSLADVQWGSSVTDDVSLIAGLKGLNAVSQPWLGSDNPFSSVKSAADVAKTLPGQKNSFLQGFSKWLIDNAGLTPVDLSGAAGYSITVNAGAGGDHAKDTTVITVPTPGYYLVAQDTSAVASSPAVSEFILAVLGTQEVDLKADAPTMTKTIDDSYHHIKADVKASDDIVQFRLTGTLPKNFDDYAVYYYVFHDTLPKGLTYGDPDGNTSVPEHPAPDAGIIAEVIRGDFAYILDDSEYNVLPEAPDQTKPGKETQVTFTFNDLRKAGGLTYTEKVALDPFGVSVEENGKLELKAGDEIVITYWATVNEDAETGYGADGYANKNVAYLEYSNNPNANNFTTETAKTTAEEAHVYTFGLAVKKHGDDEDHQAGLPGAGFILTLGDPEQAEDDSVLIAKFSDEADGKRSLVAWEDMDPNGDYVSDFVGLYEDYQDAYETYAKAPNTNRDNEKAALDLAAEAMDSYVVTSKENGQLPNIVGLGEADEFWPYYLTEVVTPPGYDVMAPTVIEIKAIVDGDDTDVEEDNSDGTGILSKIQYTVDGETKTLKLGDDTETAFKAGLIPIDLVNYKSAILPNTGGTGVTSIYFVGAAVLFTGAIALYFASRRKGKST